MMIWLLAAMSSMMVFFILHSVLIKILEDEWDSLDLTGSNMNATGQLTTDLALTDSDEDELNSAKRQRLDEDLDTF